MNHPINSLTEEWRPVVGYEGVYEVSDHGRVRRIGRGRGIKRLGQPMRACTSPDGYVRIRLNNYGGKTRLLHRLVAAAFLGPCADDEEVHHADADRTHNHVRNLSYVTRSGNMRACVEAGRCNAPRGERHYFAKLSEDDVRSIRRLYPAVSGPKLAARFGVSTTAVYAVLNRVKWKHLG